MSFQSFCPCPHNSSAPPPRRCSFILWWCLTAFCSPENPLKLSSQLHKKPRVRWLILKTPRYCLRSQQARLNMSVFFPSSVYLSFQEPLLPLLNCQLLWNLKKLSITESAALQSSMRPRVKKHGWEGVTGEHWQTNNKRSITFAFLFSFPLQILS